MPRVLVVDDSVVSRQAVSRLLASEAGLETQVAADGFIALDLAERRPPDLVILDVEMPRLNGLDTLVRLREKRPDLPVLMLSASTEAGAKVTLEALALGASDYLAKPTASSDLDPMDYFRRELLPRVEALLQSRKRRRRLSSPPGWVSPPAPASPSAPRKAAIVVVGASTGGPVALESMLSMLGPVPVPLLVVQHMPPDFLKTLAERLASKCRIPVSLAAPGLKPEAGNVILAPGDFHLEVDGETGACVLHQGPPENFCRPSCDTLFRSVARRYGSETLAVILTGMGQDGLQGCQFVKAAGGQVLAQDEASSVVWGMPGAVFQAGLADEVLPLEEISARILGRLGALPESFMQRQSPNPVVAPAIRNP